MNENIQEMIQSQAKKAKSGDAESYHEANIC